MKNGIKASIYYELLEWKDEHMSEFIEMHGQKRLNDFTPDELHKLHQAIQRTRLYEVGDKVHYIRDKSPFPKAENGIIKNFGSEPTKYFVVYNCGGEWDNYKEYTAALTDGNDLKKGWI